MRPFASLIACLTAALQAQLADPFRRTGVEIHYDPRLMAVQELAPVTEAELKDFSERLERATSAARLNPIEYRINRSRFGQALTQANVHPELPVVELAPVQVIQPPLMDGSRPVPGLVRYVEKRTTEQDGIRITTLIPGESPGEPPGFIEALVAEDPKLAENPKWAAAAKASGPQTTWQGLARDTQVAPSSEALIRASEKLAAKGRELHLQTLGPAVDLARKKLSRRGWSEPKLEELIEQMHASRDSTVWNIAEVPDGPGGKRKIVALIGVSWKLFGAVDFENLATGKRERHFGQFGSGFLHQYWGKPEQAAHVLLGETPPAFWSTPIDSAPTESTWGMPLPALRLVPDTHPQSVVPPAGNAKREAFYRDLLPPGIRPDLTKPILFSAGGWAEPVKFILAEDFDQRPLARQAILTALYRSIARDDLEPYFIRNGVSVVTNNPVKKGANFYERLFNLSRGYTGLPTKTIDGQEWTTLGAPADVILDTLIKLNDVPEGEVNGLLRDYENASEFMLYGIRYRSVPGMPARPVLVLPRGGFDP